ncbi:MAG TPA: hypothetical protein VHV31_01555 [Nitrolancea sp.]|jgi:hypothetical protein|nr:hypothetical protein [Nitrolancea sp.]
MSRPTALHEHSITNSATEVERRLPFVLRVATTWTNVADLPPMGDGELRFFARAPLTGEVVTTSDGRDVHFSDLEV